MLELILHKYWEILSCEFTWVQGIAPLNVSKITYFLTLYGVYYAPIRDYYNARTLYRGLISLMKKNSIILDGYFTIHLDFYKHNIYFVLIVF